MNAAIKNDEGGYPRKRAQTRGRLMRAGMKSLAAHGPDGATVGEIASAAGVAAGTFYNHFQSVPDLVDAIAEQLGLGVEIGQDALDTLEHDPAARVALGTLQLLDMANTDPTSAAAFAALVAAKPDFRARVRAIVGRAIADGVDAGRFDVEAGPAATNAVLGTALQSMRSRVLNESDGSDAIAVTQLVLRILGVGGNDITTVVARASESLQLSAQLTGA